VLRTLAIENYRSLRSLVLPLGSLTVVRGANGTGKSSLYRALRLLAESARNGAVAALAREGGMTSTLWAGPETISRAMREELVGSGVRSRALEDAIALFNCFEINNDVEAALHQFEAKRRPIIEEYQQAAKESLVWFENMKDYMHLDPLALAYELMTRSKRINLESLKRRDPDFFAAYEARQKNVKVRR